MSEEWSAEDREKLQQYHQRIEEMLDEAKPLMDGFASLFPDDSIGQLKYLFTLHCMVVSACRLKGIPIEHFDRFVPSVVAVWQANGRPEKFDIQVLGIGEVRGKGGVN